MASDARTLGSDAASRLADLADVVSVLARFHDREVDARTIDWLRQFDVAGFFAEVLTSAPGRAAAKAFTAAVVALPERPSAEVVDDLAAEYASIYLNHAYRASPSGSVWLTEDRLERQMPMFDVREWYDHYDISVPDWRRRADDHIVPELEFVAHLCRFGAMSGAEDAAGFLDGHVLNWMPEFLEKAARPAQCALYRAILQMTDAVLDELRDELEAITGRARQVAFPTSDDAQQAETAAPYFPGVAESW